MKLYIAGIFAEFGYFRIFADLKGFRLEITLVVTNTFSQSLGTSLYHVSTVIFYSISEQVLKITWLNALTYSRSLALLDPANHFPKKASCELLCYFPRYRCLEPLAYPGMESTVWH